MVFFWGVAEDILMFELSWVWGFDGVTWVLLLAERITVMLWAGCWVMGRLTALRLD